MTLADSVPDDIGEFVKETIGSVREQIAVNGYEIWLVCRFLKRKG